MARSWPSGERLLRVEVALGPRSSVSAAEALVLELRAGDVVGLLGDTARGDALLAHLAAAEGGDTPEVRRLAPEVSLGVLGEAPAPREDLDVRGALRAPVQHLRAIEARYLRACEDPEGREPEVEHLRELMDRHDVWTLDGRVQDVAAGLEVPTPETRLADVDEVARRRVALAALLLREPDVLVLDDPARGLSAAGARWLCGDLRRRPGAVLLRAPARRLLRDVAVELLEPGPPARRLPCWDVTGAVTDPRGRPLADVVVTATPRAAPAGPAVRAVTDARGAFALEVDGPGPFRLELHARPAHGDVRPLTPLVPFDPAPGGARALLLRVHVDPPDAGAGVPAR